MLLAFIVGWVLGSFSLYSYIVLTAKEPPYPECMDCHEPSCDDCEVLVGEQKSEYGMAA